MVWNPDGHNVTELAPEMFASPDTRDSHGESVVAPNLDFGLQTGKRFPFIATPFNAKSQFSPENPMPRGLIHELEPTECTFANRPRMFVGIKNFFSRVQNFKGLEFVDVGKKNKS